MGDTKNLYQRIVAIMADMGAVGKGGKTTYGEKYAYHKIDDIDDKLRQSLVDHGVVASISKIDDRHLEHFEGTDKQGNPRTTWYAECALSIELVNADTPEERMTIMGWGQGLDYSDKATGKAISYAAKAAYLSAFHLRGQPDNESDNIPRTQKATTPKLTPQEQTYVDDAEQTIAACDDLQFLTDMGVKIKERSAAVQDELRPSYTTQYRKLQQLAESEPLPY
uniref:Putative Erf family protein n=1 Tax=viral metagenome TaxID=1070528 RepID=A0A6M3L376_9ZZZZ